MGAQNPTYLKSRFKNGDKPDENDFGNFIDTVFGIDNEEFGEKLVLIDGKWRTAYYFDEDSTWRVLMPLLIDGSPTVQWITLDESSSE